MSTEARTVRDPVDAGHQRRWPYLPSEAGPRPTVPNAPACLLPPQERRERQQEIRKAFVPGILEIEELEDGYVYWFDRTDAWFSIVAEFALFESRCCGFLDFEIGLQSSGSRISLRISGPPASKQFLAQAVQEIRQSGSEIESV